LWECLTFFFLSHLAEWGEGDEGDYWEGDEGDSDLEEGEIKTTNPTKS